MFRNGCGGECDNLWTELQNQKRQKQETHQATGENGKQEMPEIHFEYRCSKHKHFEGEGWRNHRRKHQSPELVAVKRAADLVKLRSRDSLFQQYFAALIPDEVQNNAAHRRSCRGHHCVEEKTSTVVVNVAGDQRIKRKSKECGINSGYSKNCPRAKGLQHGPDKTGVPGENMFENSQDRNSTRRGGVG